MADPTSRTPENVPGKYYVDDTCNACLMCVEIAPDHFQLTDDEEHAFVCKQPVGDDQESTCEEAMESCPEEAIGNNG